MAGLFKIIYDWLLRTFWWVLSLPLPLLLSHVNNCERRHPSCVRGDRVDFHHEMVLTFSAL